MENTYKGLCLDYWCQIQTLNPRPEMKMEQWFTGYDTLSIGWFEMTDVDIPLDVRFENFCNRLKAATERRPHR